MIERATNAKATGGIAHHIRAAMRLGNCSRAIAHDINKKRAKMGLSLVDLTGIETPAEVKIRKVKAHAGLRTLAERALAHAAAAQAAAHR